MSIGIGIDSKMSELGGSYLYLGFLAKQGKRSSMPCRFFRINMITLDDFFQSRGFKYHLVTNLEPLT